MVCCVYVGSLYLGVVVLESMEYVYLQFEMFSERIVGRRHVCVSFGLGRKEVLFLLVLSMVCGIWYSLTMSVI